MTSILEKIVETTRGQMARRRAQCPLSELESRLVDLPPVRGFIDAIADSRDVALIAEIKKASPSAGLIRADFDPLELATTYAASGATCLSCLTDEAFFQGRLEDLVAVAEAVDMPVLRKDFLVDRYQLLEARVAGADAVLLIAECLDGCELSDLYLAAGELGLDVLLEIYEPENLSRALDLDPRLLGINNRNLKTFETDLGHTLRLAADVPATTMLVAESGIRSREDVECLAAGGVKAILVGETLMRAESVAEKTGELVGVPRVVSH
ncbi:MAG: indole-3-glycerol phosphate synthase TrpC [Planctomycetaceae bacterium]